MEEISDKFHWLRGRVPRAILTVVVGGVMISLPLLICKSWLSITI